MESTDVCSGDSWISLSVPTICVVLMSIVIVNLIGKVYCIPFTIKGWSVYINCVTSGSEFLVHLFSKISQNFYSV
jgi:hypothetical protein